MQPVKQGPELIREIDQTLTATPTLWWLGHAGFVIRFANITFYVDPCLSDPPGRTRRIAAPLDAEAIHHADMIFATHAHAPHLDTPSLVTMLERNRGAKLVLPRSAAGAAHSAGIPYPRMSTTDAGLRIEYFKDNLYSRVYAVPSAHPDFDWTQADGYPYLGYLIRFGRWTIYHSGDCVLYPELAARLRPFNVNVALLPIGGNNFEIAEAAQLARDIGASWIVPMRYGTFDEDRENAFVEHMLGHRPEQRFRTLKCGEKWTVPED
jgi:L-ascorbate metabolism protein UlaG (beta-lactamase superfamily)